MPRKIMIVEDDAIIANDLQMIVEDAGYEVIAAVNSGEKAINMAQKVKPDLVLMDIMILGLLDGIEAAAAIFIKLDIPVIYVTAHSNPDILKRIKLTNPYGHIVKPYSDTVVLKTIKETLQKKYGDEQEDS
jgi:CheY-like chemotaxis protein